MNITLLHIYVHFLFCFQTWHAFTPAELWQQTNSGKRPSKHSTSLCLKPYRCNNICVVCVCLTCRCVEIVWRAAWGTVRASGLSLNHRPCVSTDEQRTSVNSWPEPHQTFSSLIPTVTLISFSLWWVVCLMSSCHRFNPLNWIKNTHTSCDLMFNIICFKCKTCFKCMHSVHAYCLFLSVLSPAPPNQWSSAVGISV